MHCPATDQVPLLPWQVAAGAPSKPGLHLAEHVAPPLVGQPVAGKAPLVTAGGWAGQGVEQFPRTVHVPLLQLATTAPSRPVRHSPWQPAPEGEGLGHLNQAPAKAGNKRQTEKEREQRTIEPTCFHATVSSRHKVSTWGTAVADNMRSAAFFWRVTRTHGSHIKTSDKAHHSLTSTRHTTSKQHQAHLELRAGWCTWMGSYQSHSRHRWSRWQMGRPRLLFQGCRSQYTHFLTA